MSRDEAINVLVRQMQEKAKTAPRILSVTRKGKLGVVVTLRDVTATYGLDPRFCEESIPYALKTFTATWDEAPNSDSLEAAVGLVGQDG